MLLRTRGDDQGNPSQPTTRRFGSAARSFLASPYGTLVTHEYTQWAGGAKKKMGDSVKKCAWGESDKL